jgi:hypothetical protein
VKSKGDRKLSNRMLIRSFLSSMAAADLFRRDPQSMWGAAVDTIARLAKSHDLNLGESGEEYVRTAISAAVDFAFHKCYRSDIPGIEDLDPRQEDSIDLPDHLFAVSVRDWLIQLLGPEPFADNPELDAWSSRRWINFTHFGVLGQAFKEGTPLPRTHLAEAWIRQIAFTGSITQPKWDLLVVCLESDHRPKLEDLLDTRKLCPILIQVKNRDEHRPSPLARLEDLGASAYNSEECPTGVLSIYISLAAASPKIEYATRTLEGNVKSLSIYVGCNEHHPLGIFRQPSEAQSGGFSSHKAAQSLLGRWTGLFKIDIDDQIDHFLRNRFYFYANNPEHTAQGWPDLIIVCGVLSSLLIPSCLQSSTTLSVRQMMLPRPFRSIVRKVRPGPLVWYAAFGVLAHFATN